MNGIRLRAMTRGDWAEVAELIYHSTNAWYKRIGKSAIFSRSPSDVELFCQVYEDLDPGCCVVAEVEDSGRIAGSCFYHPRPTHMSLGIMNVHPDYFGRHISPRLLKFITDIADARGQPTRLVSSAMNLDSYSLYTRGGFVPRKAFADMYLPVPREGLRVSTDRLLDVRSATPADAEDMAQLEFDLVHIRRETDYRYFLENRMGIWHTSVLRAADGRLDGFLVSVQHPASNMLGPGVARTEADAAALILAELDHHRGRSPVFLVPVESASLVRQLYQWGARNCEIHFSQVRGEYRPFDGMIMPTFMPETG